MKKTLPLLVAAVGGVSLMTPAGARAQTTPLPAVIVVRHGEDLTGPFITNSNDSRLQDWKKNWAPDWPTYDLPTPNTEEAARNASRYGGPQPGVYSPTLYPTKKIQVVVHRLSDEGEKQAAFLAKSLSPLLETNKFLPVTRVVTKEPPSPVDNAPTPNPFDTAWPFIKTHGITDVILVKPQKGTNAYGPLKGQVNQTVDKDLLAMLPYYHRSPEKFADSILPTNALGQPTGSTLIVWDGQGMWGPHTPKPDDKWYWSDDIPADGGEKGPYATTNGANILRLLGGFKIGNDIRENATNKGGGLPGKMARMYIFYPRSGTGPLATNEAPAIIQANIQIEQEDAGITNMSVIPQKYNLMVWDAVPKPGGTKGWTNTINFQINEADESETSSGTQ
jgi:hypothetical protein